jgi:rhodanese-related sulfurtransferase
VKSFEQLITDALQRVEEVYPWDLVEALEKDADSILLVDIREPYEYDAMHIAGVLNVPRGILETACEYGYEETVPELADAREREVVLICRSGKRSILAADVMQQLGYQNVKSLKTGMRGWSDYEQDMVGANGELVDEDSAIDYFTTKLRPEQLGKQP